MLQNSHIIVIIWANKNELIHGHVKVEYKSNEISSLNRLIDA